MQCGSQILVHVEYSVYDPHIYKSNLSSGLKKKGLKKTGLESWPLRRGCSAPPVNYRRGQGSSPVQARIFKAVLATT